MLPKLPKSMLVVGSGAIGVEFFYNAMGADVTIVEYLPRIVPVEDRKYQQLERSLKAGNKSNDGSFGRIRRYTGKSCKALVKTKKEKT